MLCAVRWALTCAACLQDDATPLSLTHVALSRLSDAAGETLTALQACGEEILGELGRAGAAADWRRDTPVITAAAASEAIRPGRDFSTEDF